MENLYIITNNFMELMDKAENEEISEAEYNKIGEELAKELKNKSCNIIGFIKNYENYIEASKIEEKRLAERRKSMENKIERFKQYVKSNMERLELEKIDTEIGTLSLRKNPISVEIINEEEVPAEFKTVVQSIKIDKKAIADNFKMTGELINGVRINSESKSLRIK